MFVVCGEALIDVFADRETPTGLRWTCASAGRRSTSRSGSPRSFFGAMSRDFHGDRLMRALRDEGVATASTVRVDAPTTLGPVGMDAQGVPSYSLLEAA